MARRRCRVYLNDRTPRYMVLWTMHWEIIDCRTLAPGGNYLQAMLEGIEAAMREGWEAEGTPEFGFVFLRRGRIRRLLTLTPRDPRGSARQSFNPFRT